MKITGKKKPKCDKCGKFVGSDGHVDVAHDEWGGSCEIISALCKNHVDRFAGEIQEITIEDLDANY